MAQNFIPINETSHKRFANVLDPTDDAYFSFVTDNVVSGNEITFHQYMKESGDYINVMNTVCAGWGGNSQPTADTTWLGREQFFNSMTNKFSLLNYQGDTLHFDFGMTLGDSAVIYDDGISSYYLRYDALNTEQVIDSTDAVKRFTIWKYDAFNNLEVSEFNGFAVRLSENYGLVSFVDCHSFPSEERKLEMIGHLEPNMGYYQMTRDEVYPWQIGDTLQYRGYNSGFSQGGPTTVSYRTIIINDRVETLDSVWIYFDTEVQLVQTPQGSPSFPSAFNIVYSSPITFRKGEPIVKYPQDALGQIGSYYSTHRFDSVFVCGNRSQYSYTSDWQLYCDSCDCWTEYDGNGSYLGNGNYIQGLGMTFKSLVQYGSLPFPAKAELEYSNVSGIQCGLYVPLSLPKLSLDSKEKELLKIVDILGREVKQLKKGELYIYQYSDGTSEKKVAVE